MENMRNKMNGRQKKKEETSFFYFMTIFTFASVQV